MKIGRTTNVAGSIHRAIDNVAMSRTGLINGEAVFIDHRSQIAQYVAHGLRELGYGPYCGNVKKRFWKKTKGGLPAEYVLLQLIANFRKRETRYERHSNFRPS
jgi:hypothetical protein